MGAHHDELDPVAALAAGLLVTIMWFSLASGRASGPATRKNTAQVTTMQ
ncbi:MAG TPA: hypothetical protein VHZ03_45050 [Trebonia sp.]|nr:hypothetical protein [Trebonia sp.]